MTLLSEYRAFVMHNKIQGNMEIPDIEDIVLDVLSPVSLIKKEDLTRRVENRIKDSIASSTSDDSISLAISAYLAKLKKGGKADNPSRGLWKLI